MEGASKWPDTYALLRILVVVALLMMVALYIFGMEVNIYLSPPYSSSDPVFSAHYSLGILVLAVSFAVLAVSVVTKRPLAVITATIGFLATAVAGQAGRMFAFSAAGDFWSLVMSVGFLVAFGAYFAEMVFVRRPQSAI